MIAAVEGGDLHWNLLSKQKEFCHRKIIEKQVFKTSSSSSIRGKK